MDEEIRQILKNQATILETLSEINKDDLCLMRINNRLQETEELLNPKKPDPTIKEQTDKSMNRVIKAGEDCPRCGVKGVCPNRLQYHNSGRCLPRNKKVKVEK